MQYMQFKGRIGSLCRYSPCRDHVLLSMQMLLILQGASESKVMFSHCTRTHYLHVMKIQYQCTICGLRWLIFLFAMLFLVKIFSGSRYHSLSSRFFFFFYKRIYPLIGKSSSQALKEI